MVRSHKIFQMRQRCCFFLNSPRSKRYSLIWMHLTKNWRFLALSAFTSRHYNFPDEKFKQANCELWNENHQRNPLSLALKLISEFSGQITFCHLSSPRRKTQNSEQNEKILKKGKRTYTVLCWVHNLSINTSSICWNLWTHSIP